MEPIKFNEWAELGLKKDIESIKRKMGTREPLMVSIFFELIMVIISVLLTQLFNGSKVPTYAWVIIGIIAGFPLLALAVYYTVLLKRRISRIKKYKYDIKSKIDCFDNSICYWAMMGCSFLDIIESGNSLSDEEKNFYIQEINYYVNRSIYKLYEMSPIVTHVFLADPVLAERKNKISLGRLRIILDLLKKLREDSIKELNLIKDNQESINQQKKLITYYDGSMKNFLVCMKNAKINDDKGFDYNWSYKGFDESCKTTDCADK